MHRHLLAFALFALTTAGCASGINASTPAAAEESCTAETPLLPGVPGSPGNLIPSEINPNGASELADLMRRMQADLHVARKAIDTGAPLPTMFATHRRIRCAWPTELSDRNATFDTLAQLYLRELKRLETSTPEERLAAYDAVVTGCVACHENSCPGPIPAIEKLRLQQR